MKGNNFDTFTKLPKNVRDLGKLIVAKGLKKLPKVQKSPNLVTRTLKSVITYSDKCTVCDQKTFFTKN